ncbi:hypothetical protein BJV82DRAFT_577843 [Fennellomyces sp. T-0311]|nr:hypothetical protein BJV82DRAFT_577843 [Fennellomyces sp. T-0311]
MLRGPCCPAFYKAHYQVIVKGPDLNLTTRDDVRKMFMDAFTSIEGFVHVGKNPQQEYEYTIRNKVVAYLHFERAEDAQRFYSNMYGQFNRHEQLKNLICIYRYEALDASDQRKGVVQINGREVYRENAIKEIQQILESSNYNCVLQVRN